MFKMSIILFRTFHYTSLNEFHHFQTECQMEVYCEDFSTICFFINIKKFYSLSFCIFFRSELFPFKIIINIFFISYTFMVKVFLTLFCKRIWNNTYALEEYYLLEKNILFINEERFFSSINQEVIVSSFSRWSIDKIFYWFQNTDAITYGISNFTHSQTWNLLNVFWCCCSVGVPLRSSSMLLVPCLNSKTYRWIVGNPICMNCLADESSKTKNSSLHTQFFCCKKYFNTSIQFIIRFIEKC